MVSERSQTAPEPDAAAVPPDLVRAITESTADQLFVKDLVGRYIVGNPAAVAMLGLCEAEILGRMDIRLGCNRRESAEEMMANDRRTMEEELRAPRAWLRALAESLPYIVWTAGADARISPA